MKHVLMLATGGTIACRQTGHGLAPALTGEELLNFLPELQHICKVTVQNPMSVDSTDMTTAQRMLLARTIWDNRAQYDGFVITHGTDTLAYTAALLAHVLQNFDKPVILTGSVLPMGMADSDAEDNLSGAFRCATTDYAGVAAYVHKQLIRGNYIVKLDSSAQEAFRSVNAPVEGTVSSTGTVLINHRPARTGVPSFCDTLDHSVVVLRLIPDLEPDILDFLGRYHHVVLAGYGAGGVPIKLEKVVQKLIASGTRVYFTTQCVFGGADLHKYNVGRRAQAMGAICLGNRTVEDALAAIMCGEL